MPFRDIELFGGDRKATSLAVEASAGRSAMAGWM